LLALALALLLALLVRTPEFSTQLVNSDIRHK
jgi:hypothetical protein